MQSIKDRIRIEVPLAKAMTALTTESGYRGWWSKDCQVANAAGGEATLKFNKSGTIVTMKYRIDAVDPKRGVKWTCIDHDFATWIGTCLNWDVATKDGGVEVSLEHAGWKETPPEAVVQGWNHFLRSMKSYLETGSG